ncbi:MAG: SPASM domain-containing protein [Anaerohalosphaera sp.]|nr:SPASM domain-containing protein [Anaerohalosphaera sp.]
MRKHRKTPVAFWGRYISYVAKYGTIRKCWNLVRALYYYLRGAEIVRNMPAFLKVEVSRKCEVMCKMCPAKKEEVFFPLADFKKLIDRLKKYVFLVSLYDIGDPLWNDELMEYIQYAHERKIGTIVSSSLSLEKDDGYWMELVCSGLDKLIVAIDGVSPEVYNAYRTKGDLGLVMRNLSIVLRCRDEVGSDLKVEWQMLDLVCNESEQMVARTTAMAIGCDTFRLIPEATKSRCKYKEMNIVRKNNCLLPFIIFIIDAYHRVRPCYKIYSDDVFIGSMADSVFEELWNCEEIGRIRSKEKIQERSPCMTCREG